MGRSVQTNLHANRVTMGTCETTCINSIFIVTMLYAIISEVKNQHDFTKKRNKKMLIQQIKEGWNGWSEDDPNLGRCVHRAVDSELCRSYVDHCVKEVLARDSNFKIHRILVLG